jgi:hypothetical protein
MLSFPCFQVNARFDHGMSGGPVFDETGCLVGVICASLPGEDGAEHVSYVAGLAPMLDMSIMRPPAKARGDPTHMRKGPMVVLRKIGQDPAPTPHSALSSAR